MKIYSFFLVVQEVPKDFIFMEENSFCLNKNYAGFTPVRDLDDGRAAILYAITNSKHHMELFRKTRDEKKLVLFQSDLTKEKYKELLDEFSLNKYKIITEILMDGKTGKKQKPVEVVMTKYEKEKVNDEILMCQFLWEYMFKHKGDGKVIYPEVYSNKIQTLLDKLFITELMSLTSEYGANDGDYTELDSIKELNNISSHVKINTFSMFVNMFQYVLK